MHDTIPERAYHFSVSESMRHAYYIGFEVLTDGTQLNTLRVVDMFKATISRLSSICLLYEASSGLALVGCGNDKSVTIFQTVVDHRSKALVPVRKLLTISGRDHTWSWNSTRSENGMTLTELNERTGTLRMFDIKCTGETTYSEIDHYPALGLAPYTQPWQEAATLSAFERSTTPFGRLIFTGRILNIDIKGRRIEYIRPERSPFDVKPGHELESVLRIPRLMKQIYRNGRLWVITENIARMGIAVSLWTISGGKWDYLMDLEANYRDITLDVTGDDTAIILIKTPPDSGSCTNVRIKSLLMLRIGNVPKLTTIALLSLLDSPNSPALDDHMCRILERSL
ncbi:unnamed protein product [Heligmosomoides polygyrus]|uniref:MMS1_N domain-containing protein n=1 Tax=Heligmosomoides polygyrus TaxID=6339 RepID=A0A3P7XDE5_HELPZ|nr:unnamed protein product [Heligmosomoides polygyrus]